jgi:hypothetical protein
MLPGALPIGEFPLGWSFAFGLPTGSHRGQAVIPFNGAHNLFLTALVLKIIHHVPAKLNPVDHQMDVLMVGVCVATNHVLVIRKTHAVQIAVGNLQPLIVC